MLQEWPELLFYLGAIKTFRGGKKKITSGTQQFTCSVCCLRFEVTAAGSPFFTTSILQGSPACKQELVGQGNTSGKLKVVITSLANSAFHTSTPRQEEECPT